jgi:alpha-glucoside transport system substrate-binding protein
MNKKSIVLIFAIALAVLAIMPVTAQDMGDLVFPIGEGPFHWENLDAFNAMDLSGQEVTVLSPWLGPDEELVTSIFAYFEQATGAKVIHAGSDSMEQQIVIDCNAGSPSDVVVFPQPGLAGNMAAAGCLTPLSDDLHDFVLNEYAAGQSWVDLSTYADAMGEDHFFALPYKIDVKSLVWYVPDEFTAAGYEVPTTMEDLLALSQQIVDDGGTPWCIGLGSGDATGWPATDWVEDIMLRTQPPEVYDGWVTNEIPFNDERIVNAIDIFGQFAKNDAWVAGGSAAVASTDFRESPLGLFSVPPQCYMHHQASFIPSFFPEGTVLGVDADFFYLPPYASEDLGNPVLGAGTFWARTNDNPVADALFQFLTTPLAHELWMAQSGFLTPLKSVNVDAYANDTLKKEGQILLNATTFRFDASDLMPGAIGAGAFWTGMVDYVGGKSAQEVADSIQASWDAIKEG